MSEDSEWINVFGGQLRVPKPEEDTTDGEDLHFLR